MKELFVEALVRKTITHLILPGAVFEVRALGAQLKGNWKKGRVSGYFNAADELLKELPRLTRAEGIYVTLNPVDPALFSRRANRLDYVESGDCSGDSHILSRRRLLLDADPVRPSGISSTDQEKALARVRARDIYSFLHERGWPPPIISDSGNGFHLLYLLDLPANDDGLIEKVLKALAGRFDDAAVKIDRTVHNAARIVKLYGTLACKGDDTPERPHRMSKILKPSEVTACVSREQLEALVKELAPPQAETPQSPPGGQTFDIDGFLSRHGVEVKRKITGSRGQTIWELSQCPFDPEHARGEAFVSRELDGTLGFRCHHDSCQDKHWADFRRHFEPDYEKKTSNSKPRVEEPRKSDATALVRMAKGAEGFCLFHDPQDRAFVRLKIKEHTEVWPVESTRFRRLLGGIFFKQKKRSINRNALGDAITTLAGLASYEGGEEQVHLRVALRGENILIDLCDAAWRVIKVTPDGWEILDESPVAFVRTGSMQSLPEPVRGSGSIEELWKLLNISKAQRPLVAGALLNFFHPDGPYFVVNFVGEHGAAKTCAARLIRQLVDPNGNPLRSPSKEERDLLAQAVNNWCVAFDNLSSLPLWLSDALCRLATGGGHSARTLYTDLEEISLAVKRPVILNGIEDVATRPDLADRALQIELEEIPKEERITEKDLWQRFDKQRTNIFSAILGALSAALRELPRIKLNPLPRMADAALWATAGETAFGWKRGTFIAAYRRNLDESAVAAVEANPVGVALHELLKKRHEWSGEPAELLEQLNDLVPVERRPKMGWPQNVRSLGHCLRRLAPALRRAGIGYERPREARRRLIHLSKTCRVEKRTSETSQTSFTQENDGSGTSSQIVRKTATSSQIPQENDIHDSHDVISAILHVEGSEPIPKPPKPNSEGFGGSEGEPPQPSDQQPAAPSGQAPPGEIHL